nr:uncharacterized protein LOC106689688 [Halyomorpha halys]
MDLVGLRPFKKKSISGQESTEQKQCSETSTKCKTSGVPDALVKLMENEYGITYHGNKTDQVKYVKNKIKDAKDFILSEFMNIKNIPDDTKQKILGSYKKVNVKPFRPEHDVRLEDVED